LPLGYGGLIVSSLPLGFDIHSLHHWQEGLSFLVERCYRGYIHLCNWAALHDLIIWFGWMRNQNPEDARMSSLIGGWTQVNQSIPQLFVQFWIGNDEYFFFLWTVIREWESVKELGTVWGRTSAFSDQSPDPYSDHPSIVWFL
jgi:hypothetical protein